MIKSDSISFAKKLSPNQAMLVRCSQCWVEVASDLADQITQDQESLVEIIRISESEAYCLNCLESRVEVQTKEVRILEEKFIYFKQFESSYDEHANYKGLEDKPNSEEQEQERQEIVELQHRESHLQRELTAIKEDSNLLKEKILAMESEEEKFWESINKIEKRTNKLEEKSLNTKFNKEEERQTMDALSCTSPLHLLIDIKIDDNLGYVQKIPIGKKESSDINWEDVAIALGHLLLAFNFLAIKYAYEFRRIQEIRIKGSLSEIIVKQKKRPYTMFYNRENDKYFGELMEVLMLELAHFSEHILEAENIAYSEEFKLPFAINLNEMKIMEICIDPNKIEERNRWSIWTRAMRYLLINFNHMLSVYSICDKHC